jgi:hypothetical protein
VPSRILKRTNYTVATTTPRRWHESNELTWRRKTEGIDVGSQVMTDEARVASHLPTRSADTPVTDGTAVNNVNRLRQLLAGDSTFLGRLTDDVVRRIEQSVRVDRARRGI